MAKEFKEIRETQEGISRKEQAKVALGTAFEANREQLANQAAYIRTLDLPPSEKAELLQQLERYQSDLQRKFEENITHPMEDGLRAERIEMYRSTEANLEALRKSITKLGGFKAQSGVDIGPIAEGKRKSEESVKLHKEMQNKFRQERERAEHEIRKQRNRIFTKV